MLGWNQSHEEDIVLNSLYCLGLRNTNFGRPTLDCSWFDDLDVAKIVVMEPRHVFHLPDHLKTEETAHLIMHDLRALASCGPDIMCNRNIWLTAFAIPREDIRNHSTRYMDSLMTALWRNDYEILIHFADIEHGKNYRKNKPRNDPMLEQCLVIKNISKHMIE